MSNLVECLMIASATLWNTSLLWTDGRTDGHRP